MPSKSEFIQLNIEAAPVYGDYPLDRETLLELVRIYAGDVSGVGMLIGQCILDGDEVSSSVIALFERGFTIYSQDNGLLGQVVRELDEAGKLPNKQTSPLMVGWPKQSGTSRIIV